MQLDVSHALFMREFRLALWQVDGLRRRTAQIFGREIEQEVTFRMPAPSVLGVWRDRIATGIYSSAGGGVDNSR